MFDEEEREGERWLLFFNWSCYVCIFDCVLVVPLVSLSLIRSARQISDLRNMKVTVLCKVCMSQ